MKNNCLVTTLKDTVDNPSIPYNDWITVRMSSYDPQMSIYKTFVINYTTRNMPLYVVKKGNVYMESGLIHQIPVDVVQNSPNTDYGSLLLYLSASGSAVVLFNPTQIWCYAIFGQASPSKIVEYGIQYYNSVWSTVDFNALGYSRASIIRLDYTTYTSTFNVTSNPTIENLLIRKFRYFKDRGDRNYDNLTSGYVPTIQNNQPSLIESQKEITWKGQPFFNKHLYFNFDYDNDKINVFDTAVVVDDSHYSVSNKVAEYNDITKEWTFFE